MRHLPAGLLLSLCAACVSVPKPTVVQSADDADWYAFEWLSSAPYAPSFDVLDTESSLGPYAPRTKRLVLADLVRMHGHACDGLVTAAAALRVGLSELYPDGVIDRTDTGCITNNSPCFGDVASYLTGGRIRFGTQKIDPGRGASFVLHRFTTGETVEVSLRPGVFPEEVRRLETLLKSGNFTPEQMRRCQSLEWEYARDLLARPLSSSFEVHRVPGFVWTPDDYEHTGARGDIRNRDAPVGTCQPGKECLGGRQGSPSAP